MVKDSQAITKFCRSILRGTNGCNRSGVCWEAQEIARMNMTLVPEIAAEAKALVALAFRNGPIEDLHAGTVCPTCNSKPEFSHISLEEIKTVMKNSVDALYRLLW